MDDRAPDRGQLLRRLHLTGVQFYDWAYRHADLLGGGEQYDDALGQPVALDTVRRLVEMCHQVGADAPATSYLEHHAWPEAVRAAREAHVRMAAADGDDPDAPPRSLEVLAIYNRTAS